jgi:orotidine-5'-phosphate decarboxylase
MKQIYLALDFPDWLKTKQFIRQNGLQGVPVKVGMELFYREGAHVIEKLKADNHPIFLDLKLFDIPTTVRKAMHNIARLGVDIVNVHALGGTSMIEAAKEGLLTGTPAGRNTKLIAVTLLTSLEEETMQKELLIPGALAENAAHFAKLAANGGADGVVCSVHEAGQIKAACGPTFLTVTPGIRLEQSAKDDQVRIATPQKARELGADIPVIGRSVTQAENPYQAYKQALEAWENGIKL